jgi:hypothetical protein
LPHKADRCVCISQNFKDRRARAAHSDLASFGEILPPVFRSFLVLVASLNEAQESRVPVFGFLARASEARYTATTKRRGLDLGIFEVMS